MQTLNLILQELVVGLSTGAIYALIALGYTMVYGIIELINVRSVILLYQAVPNDWFLRLLQTTKMRCKNVSFELPNVSNA